MKLLKIAALIGFAVAHPKPQFKAVSFSDILTTVVYSKYQRINIGIYAHAIYIYVAYQPVTGLPIQNVMRWPHFDVFRKTRKQLVWIQIYNKFFCMFV